MNKVCSICLQELSIESFNKNKAFKDGLSNRCSSCLKQYRKDYYDKNKDHINELHRKNNSKKENKDKIKIINKIKYFKNREKNLIKMSEYYINNKEEINKKHKEYRATHKQQILFRNRERKLKLSKCDISQEDINNLLLKYNNSCHYCGIYIEKGVNLHLDHMIPLSRDGEHSLDNLVPSCNKCNLRKGTKTAEEFKKVQHVC